ncbi:hypothetical protein N657DRAFT_362314 [Parathielavia appendiculata]|uniref:Uncharacterized protein n=1 Tax=Parathielavia appendiculata TaxID=2587402 RepID=A0AAN6Z504_9PEZI|nr:hypothetical protein N657DRAFT_362314 [Parathielavia appendiculata]
MFVLRQIFYLFPAGLHWEPLPQSLHSMIVLSIASIIDANTMSSTGVADLNGCIGQRQDVIITQGVHHALSFTPLRSGTGVESWSTVSAEPVAAGLYHSAHLSLQRGGKALEPRSQFSELIIRRAQIQRVPPP